MPSTRLHRQGRIGRARASLSQRAARPTGAPSRRRRKRRRALHPGPGVCCASAAAVRAAADHHGGLDQRCSIAGQLQRLRRRAPRSAAAAVVTAAMMASTIAQIGVAGYVEVARRHKVCINGRRDRTAAGVPDHGQQAQARQVSNRVIKAAQTLGAGNVARDAHHEEIVGRLAKDKLAGTARAGATEYRGERFLGDGCPRFRGQTQCVGGQAITARPPSSGSGEACAAGVQTGVASAAVAVVALRPRRPDHIAIQFRSFPSSVSRPAQKNGQSFASWTCLSGGALWAPGYARKRLVIKAALQTDEHQRRQRRLRALLSPGLKLHRFPTSCRT